ncbi:MAG: hypothetical protein ACAI44_37785 [Candidatus Sericytochromatia bacterium]
MQQARQVCPFFQLEQRAADSPAPQGLESGWLEQQPVLPEICAQGLPSQALAWSIDEQIHLCQRFQAWIVNIESSFYGGSPQLLEQLRREYPKRYLIARDLVVDEYQILQARTAGANALMLSNALLGARRTQLYLGKIRFWEMEPVLEIHSLDDLRLAQEFKVRLVSLAPFPGYSRDWTRGDLLEVCRLLRNSRLLIYAGLDRELLEQLVHLGITAVAPGWQLWQDPDPAARLKAIEEQLTGNR